MRNPSTQSPSARPVPGIRQLSLVLMIVFALAGIGASAQPAILGPAGTPEFGETFYIKENARNRKPEAYVHEREADIMWSKRVWRTIDLREKFNHPMYFPENPLNDRKSLFDVIKTGVLSGEIAAFDNPFFDDEFKVRMSKSQISEMFFATDSQSVENPNEPGTFFMVANTIPLTSTDIKQYWVKEDWFFDKERSVMDVRILGLCPMKEKKDPVTDEMIGVSPLFWVYFPQCRNLFAKAEVFNTKNDAQRNTYDDLFSKRVFSSFVRKESNVFNREIGAYATGIDAMLEADRVKDDIFKTEHDVWHF